jgi:N-formylglutamate amidohydrolase
MPQKYPILITIPHGSIFVPKPLRRLMNLSEFQIKKNSDPYTMDIFDIPNAHVVKGKSSRLVADLNRAPDDIEMEHHLSNRGVVVSVDIDGNPIYKTQPSIEMISDRVSQYHDAFHHKIEELKPNMKFLIDGHSMRSVTPSTKPDAGSKRADIVLGNRHYVTCSRVMTRKIMEFFEARGFKVAVNEPFTGRYIIGYHCSRSELPGIQVEFNEKLFINPKTYRPYKKNIRALQVIMTELVEMIHEELVKSSAKSPNPDIQGRLF